MTTKINIDPFHFDDIEDGLYLGNPDDEGDTIIDFDLRAAANYARDNNLSGITEEIQKMFRVE